MLFASWNNTAVITNLCYCQDYCSCINYLHGFTSNDLFAERSIQFGPADDRFAAPVDVPMYVVHCNGLIFGCRHMACI